MEKYVPPFDITNKMFGLSSLIMEQVGRLSNVSELEKLPRLRRVSRIKSIHSSLAIENNTLSIQQVTDVIDGKKVSGPADDILAVKNAFAAYKELENIDPYSLSDLQKIHGIMMNGLVSESGKFRTGDVGVFDSDGNVIHVAPPADLVRGQVEGLFGWLKNSDTQMLIKSSVFHYEFEFIHPFRDGNGRMGRLWQTALLASWKPIFKYIPVESIIKDNQEEYYKVIRLSTAQGKSNQFVEFMLEVILKAITDIAGDAAKHYNHLSIQINKLMRVLESYPQSAQELMEKLGLKSRGGFRKNYLNPAIEAGLVGMTIPDKPTSKSQMYFKLT